ncbi:MAG: hypothetical protein M3Y56_03575, partial [Armatimonadota bacterium]|nr:hypothetical protein [Armatimonadota bacterium]
QQATQVFSGVVVQNILGAYHASTFPRPGVCHTVRVPEWDGHQIVDGKQDGSVLMVLAAKGGQYHKFILRFAPDYASYDLRTIRDVSVSALNFVTLDSGVCLHLEGEDLELFSSRKDSPDIKVLSDPALAGATLFKHGAQVYFAKGKTLYSMTMKQ